MRKGRRDRPGPGSACGGLWTTGLQDRLVSTMAAMISSISTDSGLRKLGTTQRNTFKNQAKHPHTQAGVSCSSPVWSLPGSSHVAPASLWLFYKDFLGLGCALRKRLHTENRNQWASMISYRDSGKTRQDRTAQDRTGQDWTGLDRTVSRDAVQQPHSRCE